MARLVVIKKHTLNDETVPRQHSRFKQGWCDFSNRDDVTLHFNSDSKTWNVLLHIVSLFVTLVVLVSAYRFIADIVIAYLLAFLLFYLMNLTTQIQNVCVNTTPFSKFRACNLHVPHLRVYPFMCNVDALSLDADTNCFGIEWEGSHVPTLNCTPIAPPLQANNDFIKYI